MAPQYRGVAALIIAFWFQAFGELIVGKNTCLWESVHAPLYFYVYVAVTYQWQEVVLDDDLLWDDGNVES